MTDLSFAGVIPAVQQASVVDPEPTAQDVINMTLGGVSMVVSHIQYKAEMDKLNYFGLVRVGGNFSEWRRAYQIWAKRERC